VVYSIGHLLDDFHGFEADGADPIERATVDRLQADRETLISLISKWQVAVRQFFLGHHFNQRIPLRRVNLFQHPKVPD
jgi:hypothetical protein